MGNCVHCFMVCSQIRHVSILDASPGFKKLQICHHIRHIDSEHGNVGHTISLPHRLQPSIQSIKQSLPISATSQTASSQPATSSNSPSKALNVEPLKPVGPETHLI